MYAKLRFKAGVKARDVNRAIVKAVTDCYTAPGSVDLTGYPAIDSNFTTFYSTDSSHWTFAGGGTLGSDSEDYSINELWHGSQYTLKCNYDTGHIVYCDMRIMGTVDNSSIYDNTNNFVILPVPRNRFGTALEELQLGETIETNPSSATLRNQGLSTVYNKEIHVFADQTKLIIAGSGNSGSADTKIVTGLWQFPQTNAMKYRDKINAILDSNVPSCWTYWGTGTYGNNATAGGTAYRDGGAWTTGWDDQATKNVVINFPGNIYNERTGEKTRNVSLITSSNTASRPYLEHSEAIGDDDVTARPTTGVNSLTSGLTLATDQEWHHGFTGYATSDWGGQGYRDADVYDAVIGDALNVDSNGNRELPVRPIRFDWQRFGGNEVNMSEKAGIYHTVGNVGFWGDSADIGASKYQYFPLTSTGALLIRRD